MFDSGGDKGKLRVGGGGDVAVGSGEVEGADMVEEEVGTGADVEQGAVVV